ncbi:hypothetical protein [Streptomyces sp. NRRL S-37]|uniref:hypothetical protein n=1 Tax=Streptomyces sp. NRRL S-37 TaxID=1463903 RepID=UPI0004CBCCFD|nr:hypothetical protein [Streptomyces sp. NRRL S-37]
MSSKKVVAAVVLAAALTWSTVMTVLGHAAAAAVLLPSLGLLTQQVVQALTPSSAGVPAGRRQGGQEVPR